MSNWKKQAELLAETGMSWRKISKAIGVPKSTVSDYLRNQTKDEQNPDVVDKKDKDIKSVITSRSSKTYKDHVVIPDTQVKKNDPVDHLRWAGRYCVDHKPEVIVHIGDHADMPSLSSYDKGKRTAEGKRVNEDIEAAVEGMKVLLSPIIEEQQRQLRDEGKVTWKPRLVLTLGNHEERILRHVNANPELYGFLSIESLRYKDFGWEVYDFLEPVVVDGVTYCHYMANPFSGKPYGGSALNILKHVGESFTMGHKQTLDVTTRFLPSSGKQQWGIIAGAFYQHDEGYKGPQGNKHWRGIVHKRRVIDGSYDPEIISLERLRWLYD